MSLHKFAEQVAASGRGDDSLLVHMTPDEVRKLQQFAEANGTTLTINPETGLPEAGFLSDLFKAVAPIALGAFLGPGAFGIAGMGLSAGTAGLITGGITSLATGSLSRGLMAGLGAYGGAGLAEGLAGAGAGVLGQQASEATAMELANAGAGEGLTGEAYNKAFQQSVTDKLAGGNTFSAGLNAAKDNPMGFAKGNLGNLAYAASPIMAGLMVPTTTKMPEPRDSGFIRQFDYNINPETGKPDPLYGMRAMTPVKASEFGNKTFQGQRDLFRQQNPDPYELGVGSLNQPPLQQPARMNTGGIVALANGGPPTALSDISGRLDGGFFGMDEVNNAYTAGGGSLGYTSPVVKTAAKHNALYNKQTNDSLDAYNFLMGKGKNLTQRTATAGRPVMRRYDEAVLGRNIPSATTVTGNTITVNGVEYNLTDPTNPPPSDSTGTWQWDMVDKRWVKQTTTAGADTYQNAGGLGGYGSSDSDSSGSNSSTTGGTADVTTTGQFGQLSNPLGLVTLGSSVIGNTLSNIFGVNKGQDINYSIPVVDLSPVAEAEAAAANDAAAANAAAANAAAIANFDAAITDASLGAAGISNSGTGAGDGTGDGGGTGAGAGTGNAMAKGGMLPGYAIGGGLGSLGTYSDGGRLLKGPGDGVSDSIPATIGRKNQPARLADGEFVIPARIVSELGNGSTDAGAKKLYAMMDRVQRARGKTTGKNKVAANSRADKYLPA